MDSLNKGPVHAFAVGSEHIAFLSGEELFTFDSREHIAFLSSEELFTLGSRGLYYAGGSHNPPPPIRRPNLADFAELVCRTVGFLNLADLFCRITRFLGLCRLVLPTCWG